MIGLDLAAHYDPPWADLRFTGLPVGTASVRVSRLVDDRDAGELRGSAAAVVTGTSVRLFDYDVPVGRVVAWRITALSASGGVLEVTRPAVTMLAPAGEPWEVWLSDPYAPTTAVKLEALAETDSVRALSAPNQVAVAASSRLPMGVAGGVRQAPSFPVSLRCSPAQADQVELIAASGDVMLLRPHPIWRHPTGLIYLMADDLRAVRHLNGPEMWEQIGFEAREVRSPRLPAVTAFRTWADIDAEAGTFSALSALYPTYNALDRGA